MIMRSFTVVRLEFQLYFIVDLEYTLRAKYFIAQIGSDRAENESAERTCSRTPRGSARAPVGQVPGDPRAPGTLC